MPIGVSDLRTGTMTCANCGTAFETTAFSPREVRHTAVTAVTQTPDGVAAACANHAGNAAVSSCDRCGLFICALCELAVDEITYCPSCFDRMSAEGTLEGTTRYRDYAAMALGAAVAGVFCAPILGPFAIFWSFRAINQRRGENSGITGPVLSMIFGIIETLAGFSFFVSIMYKLIRTGKP